MKTALVLLLTAFTSLAATFEFFDPNPANNAPVFYTVWRYQSNGLTQVLRINSPTNPPPRAMTFSLALPLGTNLLTVSAHSSSDQSAYSNLLLITNNPVAAPFNFKLAPLKSNVSLILTGSVTFSESQ